MQIRQTKHICSLLAAVLGVFIGTSASAHSTLELKIARAVAAAQMVPAYQVQVTTHFQKTIYLRERMLRTPRRPANPNQILRVEHAQKQCRGVLVNKGEQVVVPSVCLAHGEFAVSQLVLHFANGQEYQTDLRNVALKEDVAWITINTRVVNGLKSAVIGEIDKGKTLQEMYGEPMTAFLEQWFRARGVAPKHRYRMGYLHGKPKLEIGEPLFYRGYLVALVKNRVPTYRNLWGNVSERAFALVRSLD
jgi:hypothetical protein